MTVLRIEHPVASFDAWKAAFDRDPVGRSQGGVRRYRIYRAVDDPSHVAIELEFEDRSAAEAFRGALARLWGTGSAAAVLGGAPTTRIAEVVEDRAS